MTNVAGLSFLALITDPLKNATINMSLNTDPSKKGIGKQLMNMNTDVN
jgi:hypothetical protein